MVAVREPYAHVVAQFRTDLDFATLRPTVQLPELASSIRHDGELTDPDISGYRDGMYVIDESELARAGFAHFVPKAGRRIGREMSHNNVLFGDLRYETEERSTIIELAVKPCEPGKVSQLVGEIAMSSYMRSLGIAAFEPYGLVLHGKRGYMLTRFDGPVTTLDTLDWRGMDPEEAWAEAHLATDTLALLHGNMLFHGDADFRNIAQNEVGEPRAVDPEYTKSARDLFICVQDNPYGEVGDRALGKIARLMSADLSDVSKAAQAQIINQNLVNGRQPSSAQLLKIYKRNLYAPYLEQLRVLRTPALPLLERAYQQMICTKKRLSAEEVI